MRTSDWGDVSGWIEAGDYDAAVDPPATVLNGARFSIGGPTAEGPTHTPGDAPALPLTDGWSKLDAYAAAGRVAQ